MFANVFNIIFVDWFTYKGLLRAGFVGQPAPLEPPTRRSTHFFIQNSDPHDQRRKKGYTRTHPPEIFG